MLREAGYEGRVEQEPFPITLGIPGFYFLLSSIYRPKQKVWVTPQTEEEIKTASFNLIYEVLMERLSELKLAGVSFNISKTGFNHIFAFQANNPLNFALLQWYLEEFSEAVQRACLCKCGLPALPGRFYASDKCATKHRQREYRNRNGNIDYCPTCGQHLDTSETKRRVGQTFKKCKVRGEN